jgi:hypothetical protein
MSDNISENLSLSYQLVSALSDKRIFDRTSLHKKKCVEHSTIIVSSKFDLGQITLNFINCHLKKTSKFSHCVKIRSLKFNTHLIRKLLRKL